MSDLKGIAGKLVLIAKDCAYAQKDAKNQQQGYKYVSAAHILGKVNESLAVHNVCSVPDYSIIESKETTTAKGAIWQLVTVKLQLQIIDADSGESVIVTSLGTGTDPGDKAVAKAQTMAIKYAWLTALNIETGDNPEADERTDKNEFVQPGTANTALDLPDNPKINEIYQIWQQLNWNPGYLPGYLAERFKKPASQVTDTELTVIVSESYQHLQQRTVQQ
jgi:hypothetical protein